ncbi:probable LRR receptor-like serine/threonine-protein kinase At3g47570 [Magnolia sinica]|uniref:probable LRR receptor-like serine/threonine-protein kinase At3g47570 n=1 Tax=Magnolia sinica TaxID=86752 RepID=UPI0026584E22|nr:probable LRR receptor-like serine/threonine-protein kinase At3g47570 [Magnolia sinica]
MAECNALRNIRHRNLVKILTCCSSIDFKGNDFKALVYEYMPNGSLEKWLHMKGHDQLRRNLKFTQRLNIAIDVVSALDYLHNLCQTSIIHQDLKPSNILLDDDMIAHVSDFGLSRFLSEVSQSSSVGMKGSIGYIAPESPRKRMHMRDVVAEMHAINDLYLGVGIHRDRQVRLQILDEGLSYLNHY